MFATLLAFCALADVQPTGTVTLTKGKDGYFAVEDTFLDNAVPEMGFGRDALLSGGPGKAILIRFGDLWRYARAGAKVHDVVLRLPIKLGDTAKLNSISKMLVPWHEGPDKRGIDFGTKKIKDLPPALYCTWKQRQARDGGSKWSKPGASGGDDASAISGATATLEANVVTIRGLDEAVQAMVDDPATNYGFRLEFGKAIEFASSETAGAGPSLSFGVTPGAVSSDPDLLVESFAPTGIDGKHWPSDKQMVTWTARVRNVGGAASHGFNAKWTLDGQPIGSFPYNQDIAPGEVATAQVSVAWSNKHRDHRTQLIRVTVAPTGPDARKDDKALEVPMNALSLGFMLPPGGDAASAEEALQHLTTWLNEEVLSQARSSFAREGCLERFRVQSVGAAADASANAQVSLTEADVAALKAFLKTGEAPLELAQKVLVAAGLPSKDAWMAPVAKTTLAGGKPLDAHPYDRYPGLLGWGDTRDDLGWPQGLAITDPLYRSESEGLSPMTPTGLMGRGELAVLNGLLGKLGDERSLANVPKPQGLMIRVLDALNRPERGTAISVYQSDASGLNSTPIFAGETDLRGTVLAMRGGSLADPFLPDASNGWFYVQTSVLGQTQGAWIPAWKLWEEYARGNKAVGMVDVHTEFADEYLTATNQALGKPVSDSMNHSADQLKALVDGDGKTAAEFDAKPGDWIEIDLGSEQYVGDVTLEIAGSAVWEGLNLRLRKAEQSVDQARYFAKETLGAEMLKARGVSDGTVTDIPYRGECMRARYIRVECVTAGKMTLAGVRVFYAAPRIGGG